MGGVGGCALPNTVSTRSLWSLWSLWSIQSMRGAFPSRTCFAHFAALLLLMCALPVFAAVDDFESANQLFDKGKFSEALAAYEHQVSAGQWNANLFYNLGNCEYRLGSPGRAMLDYERALLLDPSQPEARANLSLLRGQTGAKVSAHFWEQSPLAGVSANAWSIAASAAAWIAIFGLAALSTTMREETGGLWLITLVGFAICGAAVTLLYLREQDRNTAIVTAKSAEARFAPVDTAELADTLPAGSRVRLLSERGDWVYCELPGATRAWIPRTTVEKVRIEKS